MVHLPSIGFVLLWCKYTLRVIVRPSILVQSGNETAIIKAIRGRAVRRIEELRVMVDPGDKVLNDDQRFMQAALDEALAAKGRGEVPIGAVIVLNGAIIGRGHNLRETGEDPTAHAEMLAIRQAAAAIGHWRLLETTLYVTLEPCVMCMGAIILARIPRLVYACRDPRAGAAGSIYDFSHDERFNHRVAVTEGVLSQECSEVLSGFFKELRTGKKLRKPL